MKISKQSKLAGSILWILSLQYYVAQYAVAASWHSTFSLRHNTISDLGNTVCGLYGSRTVCSPQHAWMNISFYVLGLTMIFGSAFMYQTFTKTRASSIGFSCLVLAGIGTIIVGLFPENTISGLHILGAALPFVFGNLALIVLGRALDLPRWLQISSIVGGALALVALVLLLTNNYLGLDIGGMERIVAYPQSIWMIIVGTYQLKRELNNGI